MEYKNCKNCEKKYNGKVQSKYCSIECRKVQIKIQKNNYVERKRIEKKLQFDLETKGDWVPIRGYENLYLINRNGQVKSITKNSGGGGKLLKKSLGKNGYFIYGLRKLHQKNKNHTLHRLVALHFIDNPNNLPMVDHIDRNRQNNNINNLRWVTAQTNNRNSSKVINKTGCVTMCKEKRKLTDGTIKIYIYYKCMWSDKNFKRKSKTFKLKEQAELYLSTVY